MRIPILAKIAGILAIAAMLATPQARASLTFDLTAGNAGLTGQGANGPYGTVSVTRVDNNDATITLTGIGVYSFGGQGMIGLNLAGGGTFTITSVTGTTRGQGAAVLGSFTVQPNHNEDGWGSYNFTVDNFDGFKYSVTSLTFNVHTTSGAWTTEADILTANGSGLEVAGHIFTATSSGADTGITGYATTPEPSTIIAGALLLLPFGASTLRVLRRNRTA